MSRAKDLIANVRKELTDHIIYEMEIIHRALHKEDVDADLNYPIYTNEEEWPCSPHIKAEVDNSYLDVEDRVMEDRAVTALLYATDNDGENGELTITDEGDEERSINVLTTDELADIAVVLEKTIDKINKK